jgi:hypothetical protein
LVAWHLFPSLSIPFSYSLHCNSFLLLQWHTFQPSLSKLPNFFFSFPFEVSHFVMLLLLPGTKPPDCSGHRSFRVILLSIAINTAVMSRTLEPTHRLFLWRLFDFICMFLADVWTRTVCDEYYDKIVPC